VCEGASETVRVGWEINSSNFGFQVEDRSNETWVLMRKAVMFLLCPSRSLNVVERSTRLAPFRLVCLRRVGQCANIIGREADLFTELTVLDHHGMDNPQERFIAGKQARSPRESITLQHSLTDMLR